MTFTFILGSTRKGGNSETLARRAARSLTDAQFLHLLDLPLPPFFDTRHSTGYAPPDGNAKVLCNATLAATDLVLVTPVNWYSCSWPMKLYLDHWSAWMRIPELAFKDTLAGRSMWGVIVDSDDDASGTALATIDMFKRTADYMSMHWRGVLLGHGNRPGEVDSDAAALAAADAFFTRSA